MPKHKDSQKDDEKPAFEDAALGFVYKSLISRDPNKRRIKPVESILSYDPALDDSESDDSDYNPAQVDDEDGDIESDGEEEKEGTKGSKIKNGESKQNGNQDDSSSGGDSSSSDDSIDEDEEEDDANLHLDDLELDETNCIANNTLAKSELLLSSSSSQLPPVSDAVDSNAQAKQDVQTVEQDDKSRLKKILVCCVCLGDVSRPDDEIVDCDACGISVHELCYGITADDAESVHSNASSASTEPWFCDPCKAGIRSPLCDLCPNIGGIYKATASGRWVHMVCALYTHGVTFTDAERLRGPILTNLNSNRWGSKPCSLCEDERYSFTGVSVTCDAGMCKNYFHVTCAQRHGLLCAQYSDEVDPYIVYCKLHSDRTAAKLKRRNYLALVGKTRMLAQAHNPHSRARIEDRITNERTLSKLISQRQKFFKNFEELGIVPYTKDMVPPKSVFVSSTCLRRLNSKSQMLGIETYRNHQLGLDNLIDIRRKWYIQPAFSVEFVGYYLDRNDRIESLTKQSGELIKQNKQLKEMEAKIRAKYDQMLAVTNRIKTENEIKRAQICHLLSTLGSFVKDSEQESTETGSGAASDSIGEDEQRIKRLKIGRTILNMPEMQNSKAKPPFSATSSAGANSDAASLTHSNIKTSDSKSSKLSKVSKSTSFREDEIKFKQCATCTLTKDQHMLTLCDSCHLYYHLYCLDPPLRRMPKKTRLYSWQCSNCFEEQSALESANSTSSVAESPHVPTEAGNSGSSNSNNIRGGTRKLRENPKSAVKYEEEVSSQLAIFSSSADGGSQFTGGTRAGTSTRGRPRGRSKAAKVAANASTDVAAAASSAAPTASDESISKPRKRGRKPKSATSATATTIAIPPSESSTTAPPSAVPSVGKGRKRKLSTPPENSIKTESDVSMVAVEMPTNLGPSSESAPTTTETETFTEQTTAVPGKSIQSPTASSSAHVTSSHPKRCTPPENCSGCQQETLPKQSVRCDNCQQTYHFSCLIPPQSKSPKRRGYVYCCFRCEKSAEKREHSHHAHHETAEKDKMTDKAVARLADQSSIKLEIADKEEVSASSVEQSTVNGGSKAENITVDGEGGTAAKAELEPASTLTLKAKLENGILGEEGEAKEAKEDDGAVLQIKTEVNLGKEDVLAQVKSSVSADESGKLPSPPAVDKHEKVSLKQADGQAAP